MWNLEKDPALSSAFANVTILDRPIDLDRFRSRMEAATHAVPRLRQRVHASLGRLAPPTWVDDDPDLDFHIRHVALPAPGSVRQLLDLAASITAAPFDRARPLWEFTVVDGLEGDRGAMVQKLHHTITDGEGGVRMSVQFIDMERDARGPIVPDVPVGDRSAATDSFLGGATAALGHLARRQLGLARSAMDSAVEMARNPAHAAEIPGEALATTQSLVRQVTVSGEQLSPLWGTRTLRRHLEVITVDLDAVKRAAKVLGGTVNDLFVSGAAGGAGAYHRAKGAEVAELRMAMPVSTRTDRRVGGNAFAPTRAVVPVGPDPRARFTEISSRLGTTRREPAVGFAAALAGVVNILPTSVLIRMVRQQTAITDFTTSNVRGAHFPLYIAGARMMANHPIGPLAGTAWNLTTISVDGALNMGLHVDPGAVEDPALLRDTIEDSLAELIALGRPARKRTTRKATTGKRATKKAATRKGSTRARRK